MDERKREVQRKRESVGISERRVRKCPSYRCLNSKRILKKECDKKLS